MASIQSKDEIKLKRSRKYAFRHKVTGEIDGFEDLKIAKTIVLSPSWIAESEEAKKLYKKEKAKFNKEEEKVGANTHIQVLLNAVGHRATGVSEVLGYQITATTASDATKTKEQLRSFVDNLEAALQ